MTPDEKQARKGCLFIRNNKDATGHSGASRLHDGAANVSIYHDVDEYMEGRMEFHASMGIVARVRIHE